MSFATRSLVPFESSSSNENQTTINGVSFNLNALHDFRYQLYTNNTISNESNCYLAFDKFKPWMMDNGTWVNATTCYIPYYDIGTRGKASIVFGVCFGLTLIFTFMNLNRHGRLYLREDKRFRVVGRRWQWYWMLFVAACGMISTLTGVDIDRYYLQQIPIVLQGFFFMLMVPGALAMVWEATRHWASWQERQIVDSDPYGMPQDDKRSKLEFWAPLVFYVFAWIEFFMTIPRSWTALEKQNTPFQTEFVARPAATNLRGKIGSIMALMAWLVICASLQHSTKVYQCRPPPKLLTAIPILGVRVGYGIVAAWLWDLTIFRQDVQVGWPFGLGYGTILLILVVFEIAGLKEENEDRTLIKQRLARGRIADAELNITKKPSWWDRHLVNRYASDDQRLRDITREVGGTVGDGLDVAAGGRSTTKALEMSDLNVRNRSSSRTPNDPFRDESTPPPTYREASGIGATGMTSVQSSERRDLTGRTAVGNTNGNGGTVGDRTEGQQIIRSMLDV